MDLVLIRFNVAAASKRSRNCLPRDSSPSMPVMLLVGQHYMWPCSWADDRSASWLKADSRFNSNREYKTRIYLYIIHYISTLCTFLHCHRLSYIIVHHHTLSSYYCIIIQYTHIIYIYTRPMHVNMHYTIHKTRVLKHRCSNVMCKRSVYTTTQLLYTHILVRAPLNKLNLEHCRFPGVMLMQRGANPTISNGRGQKPAELSSDVWLRETIGSYIEHWERKGRYGWRPPTSQPDDVEVVRDGGVDMSVEGWMGGVAEAVGCSRPIMVTACCDLDPGSGSSPKMNWDHCDALKLFHRPK